MLHSAGANLLHRDNYGATALSMAAMKGYAAQAQYFIDNGVPVNTPDNNGRTPLMIATTHGHARTVSTLLENGACLTSQDRAGWSSVHFATRQVGGHDSFRAVLDTLLAAAHGNSSVLDLRDSDGRTALMYAVLQGTEAAVDALAKAGADPRLVDNGGSTAYSMAHSEYIKRRIAEVSAEWETRAHDEWMKNQKQKRRGSREKTMKTSKQKAQHMKNNQCPINP